MTRRAFWMVSALSLLGMAAIPASASAPPSDPATAEPTAAKREALVGAFPQSFPDRELLLRWDSRSAEQPATPEDMVQAVLRPGTADALLARLQRPSDARFLIRERMALARRAKLLRIDAPEGKLQEYVVLVWPTREARERAQAVLGRELRSQP